jgi:hypothetical protein
LRLGAIFEADFCFFFDFGFCAALRRVFRLFCIRFQLPLSRDRLRLKTFAKAPAAASVGNGAELFPGSA